MEENFRQYQISYFCSPIISKEEVSNLTQKINGFVSEMGGEIKSTDVPSIQKLSFPIKKHNQGYFSKITFFSAPDKISDLEKKIKIEKDIIRFFIETIEPIKERLEKPIKKKKPIQIEDDAEPENDDDKPEKEIKEEKETTKKKKVKLEEIDKKLEEIIGDI